MCPVGIIQKMIGSGALPIFCSCKIGIPYILYITNFLLLDNCSCIVLISYIHVTMQNRHTVHSVHNQFFAPRQLLLHCSNKLHPCNDAKSAYDRHGRRKCRLRRSSYLAPVHPVHKSRHLQRFCDGARNPRSACVTCGKPLRVWLFYWVPAFAGTTAGLNRLCNKPSLGRVTCGNPNPQPPKSPLSGGLSTQFPPDKGG